MPDLAEGESVPVQGSARLPYMLKNVGGVYSCSCPAWRNQSLPIERRTCKHLRAYRGEDAERVRLGGVAHTPAPPEETPKSVPGFLLAESWDNDRDLSGWWLSEKLDGVRAWWDGARLISRQGNVFHAPGWFTTGLPDFPLDGELWLGRKQFSKTVSIVRRHDHPDDWSTLTFQVFDAPTLDERFESRIGTIEDAFRRSPPRFASVLPQDLCDGIHHLREELARVEALGGEGLMLREPASRYEPGRSNTLLKVKTFHDAEARVVDHIAGKGRHRGRMGALLAELSSGIQFSVGTGFTDAQRERPPAIGSIITFRYQELTDRGVPRFPTFVRVHTNAVGTDASRA